MKLGPRAHVLALFAVNALLNGGLFARLPEVQQTLGLGERQYGIVLAALSVGVLSAMQVAPRLNAFLGTRRLMIASFLISAMAPVAFAIVPGYWAMALASALLGFFTALAGAAMNVEADRVARATMRPLMAQSHGTWSLFFLLVTGLSVLLVRAGVTPLQQYVALSLLVIAATLVFILPMPDAPSSRGPQPLTRFVLPGRSTFLIMGFGLISVVVEIVVRNWAIVIVRDMFAPPAWLAAAALPGFILTQTAGRFLSDRAVARLGNVAVGRLLCATTAAGLLLIALAPVAAVALLGCAVVGLGISATYPITISAVAQRGDRPVGEAVAAFIFLQNILAAGAPVLFGMLAAAAGQRLAVISLLPILAVSWVYARELAVQEPPVLPSSMIA